MVLSELGFATRGNTIRAERRAFLEGRRPGRDRAPTGEKHRCDFCAAELPAAEFERLTDGRERCSRCVKSAVDTLPELERLFDTVNGFLRADLSIKLRPNISTRFISAKKLHEALSTPFLPTASYDARTIGVAIREGEKTTVLLENGHPYHMALGTVAHELTHVWQYDNLDVQAMEEGYGKLLIEGHAMWTELDLLRQKHIAPEYCEREARRDDVYGEGYRLVVKMLEAADSNNAFELLQSRYPRR